MMDHDAMIEVIQAHKEGKQIQGRSGLTNEWISLDSDEISWNFSINTYRIKPEEKKPREFALALSKDGHVLGGSTGWFPGQLVSYPIGEIAEQVIRVREVLE